MTRDGWLCIFFAVGVLAAALCWQKRFTIARRLAVSLLVYAESGDFKARARARWGRVILKKSPAPAAPVEPEPAAAVLSRPETA